MYGKYVVLTDCVKSLSDQREQSMALISEELEVLLPRARLLAAIGAAVLSECGPTILITVAFFSALYLYFEPALIHEACRILTPPPHVDSYQYTLPQDEMIYQIASSLN